jgi:two-component system, OmpR family, response regulator RegX3
VRRAGQCSPSDLGSERSRALEGELLDDLPDPRAPGRHAAHILIVEHDSERLTKLLGALLPNGFQVSVVPDGDMMERALSERPIALVLVDGLVSTNDGGVSLYRRARDTASAPVILLGVRADEARIVQAMKHAADDYLIKPFSSQQLLERISAALCRSAGIHGPRIA